MSIDAMKLALEALEHEAQEGNDDGYRIERDALRAAIDQAQEPVAYTTGHCENHKQKGGCQLHNLQCGWPDCDRKPITTQPKMQPCAGRNCGSTNPNLHSAECFEDYEKSTGMAQPDQWQGLTDDERGQIINANFGTGLWQMAKDIEAKLKEKNT